MKSVLTMFLYWVPGILGIMFAVFISIFALHVFDEPLAFWTLMLALFLHLVPTFMVLILLALAWKREWIGSVGYIALGALYLYMSGGRFPWSMSVLIAGPAFLIGTLFALTGYSLTKCRRTRDEAIS